jgi:type II secretion system protein G
VQSLRNFAQSLRLLHWVSGQKQGVLPGRVGFCDVGKLYAARLFCIAQKQMRRDFKICLFVLSGALLLGVIVLMSRVGPTSGPAKIKFVKAEIFSFNQALAMFQVDCKRSPTTEEGLNALIQRPPAIPMSLWRGPYLDAKKIPGDPWGHAYVYKFPGLHNTNGFDVYSPGPNGVGGNEAIGNWTVRGVTH